jgi:hypothetical protein
MGECMHGMYTSPSYLPALLDNMTRLAWWCFLSNVWAGGAGGGLGDVYLGERGVNEWTDGYMDD